jgi:RNA polymerase sigma factor (sigma-70 family)
MGRQDGAMDAYAFILERLREDDFRRLRRYVADGRSAFSTWLVVVARRLCLDHYRQRYGRSPRGEPPVAPDAERALRRRLLDLRGASLDLASVPDEALDAPDQAVRERELALALCRAVGELAAEDRVLLKLRFEDALSVSEIARVLQLPSIFHVYRRLNDVFARLRRSLARRGVDSAAP